LHSLWLFTVVVIPQDFYCINLESAEAVDMNGRFQMQGGKNWFLPRDERKPVLLGLSLAGNLVKPLLSLYGTEWRERGYGLCSTVVSSKQ
jgi:hypothetical protein